MKPLAKKLLRRRVVLLAVAGALLIAVATVLLWPFIRQLANPATQAQFKAWVQSLGAWGWLLLLAIQALQIIIAFIPGEPVELLAGLLYGTWGGLALCLLGCVLASALVFTVSKKLGMPLLYRLFGREKVESFGFLKDSKRVETVVFILFLIPGTPKDMLTYVAGVSTLSLPKFLAISTFARIPSILTSTMMGASVSNGAFGVTVLIFCITALLGILGIRYKDRMIAYCKRVGGKMQSAKGGASASTPAVKP